MTDIKEALAALDELLRIDGLAMLPMKSLDSIESAVIAARTCLQSVAQEREDLTAVNAWLDADDERYQSNGRQYISGYYLTLYSSQTRNDRFYGSTSAEALGKAATWCRAEMAK